MGDATLDELLALTLPATSARSCALVIVDPAGRARAIASAGAVPDDIPQGLMAKVAQHPAGGVIETQLGDPSPWPDGVLIALPVVDAFGEIVGALCALDVGAGAEQAAATALGLAVRHVERVLDRDEEQLHLRDLSRNLARSEAALAASNRDLERFAFFAAHELQAPLRAVEAFAELLADAPDDPTMVIAAGAAVRREAAHMRGQVDGLLALSRISALDVAVAPVEIAAVVTAVVERLRPEIVDAGAEITVGDLPVVLADVASMEIVFTNLLSNALRYRHLGRPATIHISSRATDSDTVIVAVRDNGVGIAAGDVDRVFEAFQRVAAGAVVGVGLGLTLTRRIVDLCGGTISIDSAIGEGTVVELTLLAAGA